MGRMKELLIDVQTDEQITEEDEQEMYEYTVIQKAAEIISANTDMRRLLISKAGNIQDKITVDEKLDTLIALVWDVLAPVETHEDRRWTAYGSKTKKGLKACFMAILDGKYTKTDH